MADKVAFFEALARRSEVGGGVAFLIAAYLLFRKFMLPMVEGAAVARNADLVNAERRREQLRSDVSAARAHLEEVSREALSIRERGRADAQRERERIVAEGHAEGTRLLLNARGELERGRIVARDQLRIELIERALARARTIASEKVDDALNSRLVARTVDELAGGSR